MWFLLIDLSGTIVWRLKTKYLICLKLVKKHKNAIYVEKIQNFVLWSHLKLRQINTYWLFSQGLEILIVCLNYRLKNFVTLTFVYTINLIISTWKFEFTIVSYQKAQNVSSMKCSSKEKIHTCKKKNEKYY